MPSFVGITHPLHQLATVVPFKYTEEAEAFQKLKLALTNPPILAYPDPSSSFILSTDASAAVIGAVLFQEHPADKQERVVAYFSRALTTAERHYCDTKRAAGNGEINQTLPYIPVRKKFSTPHGSCSTSMVATFPSP